MDRLDCDRMFVTVLETGSFSKAAERLGTSAGQASKMISKLEGDLGVQLLKRTTRSLATTEVGRAYYERIKALLEEIDFLDASVRNSSGIATGRLRISIPASFGIVQLAPIIIDFARNYPDIQLDIDFSDRAINLVDEGFDLVVRVGNPNDSSLIARKLGDLKIVLVASPEYLERSGTPQHPEELTAHDCIIDTNYREPFLWRFQTPEDGTPLSIPVSGRMRLANTEACLQAAIAGFGIARIPGFLAREEGRKCPLVPILGGFEDKPYPVNILYPPSRHLALKVRVLVDFLVVRYRAIFGRELTD
jgi:Transcriptional regulator